MAPQVWRVLSWGECLGFAGVGCPLPGHADGHRCSARHRSRQGRSSCCISHHLSRDPHGIPEPPGVVSDMLSMARRRSFHQTNNTRLHVPQLSILLFLKAAPEENFQRRGRVLNAVEHVSIFYRVVVTTPIWLVWLHQGSPFRFIMTCEAHCPLTLIPVPNTKCSRDLDQGSPYCLIITCEAHRPHFLSPNTESQRDRLPGVE
jgi:hypothetical protein